MLYIFMAIGVLMVACGDDDEPASSQLRVSPSSISILSGEEENASFNIMCNGEWKVRCDADWIHLSAHSGEGDATIIVSSKSANKTSKVRETEILVSTDDTQAIVKVTQEGSAIADCEVTPIDILLLANSVAFQIDFGSNVDYYYTGYLEASAAGWTDERILDAMKNNFKERNPEKDEIIGFGNMESDTEYLIVTAGFNSNGKPGEIVRKKIRTCKIPNNYPYVSIEEVGYKSSTNKYVWSTVMNGSTSKYYMFATSSSQTINLLRQAAPAVVAFLVNIQKEEGDTPWAQSSSFSMTRDSNSLFIATWGIDANGLWSPIINEGIWTANSRALSKSSKSVSETFTSIKLSDITDLKISYR